MTNRLIAFYQKTATKKEAKCFIFFLESSQELNI